ncbi:hypothetical protein MN608_08587 [Microdochium nivale]|nr:hypothetical protein MN608_08587 [Microdochium nivale]
MLAVTPVCEDGCGVSLQELFVVLATASCNSELDGKLGWMTVDHVQASRRWYCMDALLEAGDDGAKGVDCWAFPIYGEKCVDETHEDHDCLVMRGRERPRETGGKTVFFARKSKLASIKL